MSVIERAIQRSAQEFRDTVWPHFADVLGGGELVPVETVTDSRIAKLLDTLAMTDAWQVVNGTGMRGLATRVQWTTRSYDTWTVRYQLPSGRDTEYHKLLREGDWQLPNYVVQSYVCDGRLIAAACIATCDLQLMLRNGQYKKPKSNPQDGTLFLPVSWYDAEMLGLAVVIRPNGALSA